MEPPVLDVEVLSWRELIALAGSPERARRLVSDGLYRRVLHGAYVDDTVEDSPGLRCAALRRALPAGVVLSGRAALWAIGVDVLPADGRVDVSTVRGKHLERRPGVEPHSALLPDAELVQLAGGLLAVSAPRAFVDVARRESLIEAVALGDAVLRSGAADAEQLAAAVDRAGGLRGVVAAREVLPQLEQRSESQGESRLRMALVLEGLPRPEAQVDFYDVFGRHVARVDLVVEGVLLEYDGREQRLRKPVFVHDRRRQNTLIDSGAELRRYSSEDVRAVRRSWLAAEVRRAIRTAAGRPPAALIRGADTLRSPRLRPLATLADQRSSAA